MPKSDKRIEVQWDSYRRDVVPVNAPDIQVRESKRAFYAGAQALMTVCKAISTERVSVEEGARILDQAERELLQFKEEVLEGRA